MRFYRFRVRGICSDAFLSQIINAKRLCFFPHLDESMCYGYAGLREALLKSMETA